MTDLRYNIRWIEHTFTSRPLTESLLSPERESGNLTQNDYEAAIRFFPGPQHRYRMAGGIAPIPVVFAFRKPSWSNARTYLFTTAASVAGFIIGHALSMSTHFSFVRSIENPAGFAQALSNIQKNIGGSSLPGPVIVRQSGKLEIDHKSQAPAPSHAETSPNTLTTDPTAPSSRWDQIRAANYRTSRNSSWDTIRQSHERKHIVDSGGTDDHDHRYDADKTRYEDRATEQAKFDALLEKERNIK